MNIRPKFFRFSVVLGGALAAGCSALPETAEGPADTMTLAQAASFSCGPETSCAQPAKTGKPLETGLHPALMSDRDGQAVMGWKFFLRFNWQ